MTDLKSMTLEEITAALRAMGEPSFRGKQVFTWLHRGIIDFDEMMNIPKSLREKLRAEYYITVPTVARKQVSKSAFPRRSAAAWAANSARPRWPAR